MPDKTATHARRQALTDNRQLLRLATVPLPDNNLGQHDCPDGSHFKSKDAMYQHFKSASYIMIHLGFAERCLWVALVGTL